MYLTPTDPMLMIAVSGIAGAPKFSDAQRLARTSAAIAAITALVPMDALQVMLAVQIVIHHFAAMDTYAELVSSGATGKDAARLRTSAAASTRCMISLQRELRLAKKAAAEVIAAEASAPEKTNVEPRSGPDIASTTPEAPLRRPDAAPMAHPTPERQSARDTERAENTVPAGIVQKPGPIGANAHAA